MTVSSPRLVLRCVGLSAVNERLIEEPKAREITRPRVQAIAEHVHSLRRAH